ncbi:MAG: hypothetical protein F4Z31_16375 [Gemmatimonadetes bacterium]|nr:hypothetical protein [Gemmatimonadota bacterium]
MPESNYLVHHEATNEFGATEHWQVQFRRLTARDLLAAGEIPDKQGTEQIRAVLDLFGTIAVNVWRDTEAVEVEDIPFEVIVEVYPLHPSFRVGDEAG